MKFGLSRGGASAAENKRSRERGLQDLEANAKKAKREEVRRLRQALTLAKRQMRDECRARRRAAVAGKREVFAETRATIADARARQADARVRLKANLERLTEECQIRTSRATGDLAKSVEALAIELRTSALARRQAKERERERPRASARETREEAIEAALRDVEAVDPALVPLVRRHAHAIHPKPRQTLAEAYLEWAAEHQAEASAAKAKAAEVHPADLMCAEAIHESGKGSSEAREWAAENCRESGKATPAFRRKTSAASRTLGMFGDIRPPEASAEQPRAGRKLRGPKKAPRGQQGISIGAFGADFLDADARQGALGQKPVPF